MNILECILGLLLLPLLCSIIIVFLGKKRNLVAPYIALISSIGVFIFLYNFLRTQASSFHHSWEWISLGAHKFNMGILIDPLALAMLTMISIVSLMITIYSIGYMSEDQSKGRFFAGLTFFMFSMIGIIVADNLIMMFIFWELVGFSSYLLIGHYFQKDDARYASKKAFIVNRVGDFGFLIGIILAYWTFGTTNLESISEQIELDKIGVNSIIGFFLICGFVGKSAQFPLHVWLPDAMAGPTPVSALIHAATMVAAGIYLLIRVEFLLNMDVMNFISLLGIFVALFAGLSAFAQYDIKRILAFSTLSQLGYMAAIFGLGFPGIALFHLITHAFFKALLFLSAGSIIHACHHEQSIFKMGGLLKKMPVTSLTFIIGTFALCGVYGFSGFYSKDAILMGAHYKSEILFYGLALGALLTAGYMGRLVWIVFFGKSNSQEAENAKEVPLIMTLPVIILSFFSIFVGLIKFWPTEITISIVKDLKFLKSLSEYSFMHNKILLIGTLAWLLGFLLSLLFYGKGSKDDKLKIRFPKIFSILESRLWIDEIFSIYVNSIQSTFARFLSFLDEVLLRGIIIRGGAGLVGAIGMGLRLFQVGKINNYVFWSFIGLIIFWVYAVNFF